MERPRFGCESLGSRAALSCPALEIRSPKNRHLAFVPPAPAWHVQWNRVHRYTVGPTGFRPLSSVNPTPTAVHVHAHVHLEDGLPTRKMVPTVCNSSTTRVVPK